MTSRFNALLSPALVRLKAKHFRRFPSLGSLENPTKKGLLLIAKRGPELWNQWQAACPQESIAFDGIDFSKYRVTFSGFEFRSDRIIFDDSKIIATDFRKCRFEGITSFNGCQFIREPSYRDAVFTRATSFEGSTFSRADFRGCAFLEDVNFTQCHFGENSTFRETKFKQEADFSKSKFDAGLDFDYAELGLSIFNECTFGTATSFRETKLFYARFVESKFLGSIDFSCSSTSKNRNISAISFAGSIFDGEANFENRIFDGTTDFGSIYVYRNKLITKPSVFNSAPLFHGCKIHQDTNFAEAIFKEASGQKSARAFRTLKLAMEQLKATREEQRFFRLEMKAERSTLPLRRQILSLLYEWCSDYGFSIRRPLAALLVFSMAIGGVHGLLANACAEHPECAASAESGTSGERTSDLIKYVLVNVAPVPGLDKMQTDLRKPLFGEHGGIVIAALFFEILHKIIALAMAFLFALGLRNLFKMKS